MDSLIAIFIPPLVTDPGAVAAEIRAAAGAISKPVVANFLGTQGLAAQLAPVPSFTFPEAAAIALAHVARYGEWLRTPVGVAEAVPEDIRLQLRAIVDRAHAEGKGWLSPSDCATAPDGGRYPRAAIADRRHRGPGRGRRP